MCNLHMTRWKVPLAGWSSLLWQTNKLTNLASRTDGQVTTTSTGARTIIRMGVSNAITTVLRVDFVLRRLAKCVCLEPIGAISESLL